MTLGDVDGAQAALTRALAAPSPPPQATLQLVLALERMNRVEEAAALLTRLQQVPPAQLGSDLVLARARLAQREAKHEQAVTYYRQLVAECAEPERRHFHGFPLAKSLDELGRHDEAFTVMVQAHASQVAWIERTAPEVAQRKSDTMRVTRFGCDAHDVAQWDHEGAPSYLESPIFVVAFPRSGTTLLEQTLDAHPRLRSMDEQPFVQNAIDDLVGPGATLSGRMARLEQAAARRSASATTGASRQAAQLQPGQRLVDKNPLNMLRLPAIARLFPNAPIDPRDPPSLRRAAELLHAAFPAPDSRGTVRDAADARARAIGARSISGTSRRRCCSRQCWSSATKPSLPISRPECASSRSSWSCPGHDAMLAPGASMRGQGIHQHAELFAGRAAGAISRSVGRWRPYEQHFAPAIALICSPICSAGVTRSQSEQQIGRDDVLVAGHRRQAFVLVHPVRRKHQQAPGRGCTLVRRAAESAFRRLPRRR